MIGKTELLEAIAGTDRGRRVTAKDQQAIQAAIANLEDRNPTPCPVEAQALLDGDWRLLYTTSRGILGIGRLPLTRLGTVYQCIRAQTARVYNVAEVEGLPGLDGLVSVAASFTPVSDKRVNVRFERFVIGLQRLIGYQSVASFVEQLGSEQKFWAIDAPINNPDQKGWLDITYLDEDLRIGRGNEGSLFVLTKS